MSVKTGLLGISSNDRYLDKRIRLIIPEHGIIFWPVLLDQIALQTPVPPTQSP